MELNPNDYIKTTGLSGVFKIERPAISDPRGFFRETYRKSDLENRLGYKIDFVQGNHSHSSKGTLRGIHIAPWHKLITVTRGQVQQVVVDLRKKSPTFGKYESIILGDDNWGSVFVPAGCGNAFLVLSESADYVYNVTDYWAAGKELSLRYDDPDVSIKWEDPLPTISQRDQDSPTLKQLLSILE